MSPSKHPYMGQDWGSGTSLLRVEEPWSSLEQQTRCCRQWQSTSTAAINSSKHHCPPRRHITFTRAGEQLQAQFRMSTGLKWADSYMWTWADSSGSLVSLSEASKQVIILSAQDTKGPMPGDGRAVSKRGRMSRLHTHRGVEALLTQQIIHHHQDHIGERASKWLWIRPSDLWGSVGVWSSLAGSLGQGVWYLKTLMDPGYIVDDVSHCTVGCITE